MPFALRSFYRSFLRTSTRRASLLAGLVLLATANSITAQAPPSPPRDPLMSLMVSQPKLEVPAQTTATAVFDPAVVRPGEQAYLRVVFNALEESIDWPTNLSAPAQLDLRPGGRGQILQMAGSNMQPRTAFNYRVRASAPGSFAVPAFVVKVDGKPVTVPSARLEVVSSPPDSTVPAAQLTLELPTTNLYVGQPVLARIHLPGTPAGIVQGLGQPQLIGAGILTDTGTARQRIEMTQHGGAMVPTFIFEITTTPLRSGKLSVFAQGFTAGRQFSGSVMITGPATIPGGPPQYSLLESDPVELSVRPLPREGQLPGFAGAIADLAVGPPGLATNRLQVGEPVQLTINVTNRGDGSLARLVAPPPPQVQDWQIVAASDSAPAQPVAPGQPLMAPRTFFPAPHAGLESVATFRYTLIPLTETAQATPPIPFSCFDPHAGTYVDLTIPSVPVTVEPGSVAGEFATLVQANAVGAEREKRPALSGLAPSLGRTAASLVPPQKRAWFPVVQLAPAVFFFGLWSWDRRRRYLEQHPDVVRRRRARRALRGQRRALLRAARAADAPRFAAAAVNAIRVACAPHYPAEPRALVGADVMPLLSETERSGRAGEVVRRFFAVTDAVRFDTAPPSAAELLPLKPELERVLEKLEQKL